jgi:nifR3 family TIM-barrel protein
VLQRKPTRCDPRLPWLAGVHTVLSPLAGITDRAFREVCRDHGADLVFCEFTSAAGLCYRSPSAWDALDTAGERAPVGVQLFGSDPDDLAAAAALMRGARLDVLDLNFGCPAKKVVRKNGGSALLADVPLLERIVRAVIPASPVPVTAKIRSGWDGASVNFEEVGLLLQEAGCAWVTLHARTRAQKFAGRADWEQIARLVERLAIPVIGNGDVVDAASYLALARLTRCHAVMVGRGAIGNPWLFAATGAAARGETPPPAPDFAARRRFVIRLLALEAARHGERQGNLLVRKHVAHCFRGSRGDAALRRRLWATETAAEMAASLATLPADGPAVLLAEEAAP